MHMEDGEDPPAICVPPPLNPALERYTRAWDLLSSDRHVGPSGAGPIPTTAIISYARHVERVTDRLGLQRFIRFVRVIDREYLAAAKRGDDDADRAEPHRP